MLRRSVHRLAATALAAAAGLALTCEARAGDFHLCDRQARLSAAQQDTLYRFADIIKRSLDQSGHSVALVARSGLDLGRFGIRYSHAGIALARSENAPWSVRQLYYACDEGKPRVYDQGISGFLLGTDNPAIGYLSVVLLPDEQARPLEQAALDKRQALRVLGSQYSANAYAFDVRYQNCNQWVMELLAAAWGGVSGADGLDERRAAQDWLQAQAYEPSVVDVGSAWLMWAVPFVPFVHTDDHPVHDLAQKQFRISMPAAIEAFVQREIPQAQRIEFCHVEQRVVVHRGWSQIPEGCLPSAGDTVIDLD
ncbi:MAG: DUF2145 domain-containing protein [Aquabacterium sp.]|uniref:DUF2145 domain-containing protein n=1 Tax=Aquabacterium sp. TaxID=1872578 RepID=UPI001209E9DC|nr:DUF2145 domain-containing protein [Aquabacterium sp.]TAK97728.1 MAG: DUF2145 domain-containing protein [Aquabacterium sp.]